MSRAHLATAATGREVFDREFLALRGKILEVAAALDRIDRAAGPASDDPRTLQLQKTLEALAARGAHRAHDVQMILSLPYDPEWRTKEGL
jgi:hypothetical protein